MATRKRTQAKQSWDGAGLRTRKPLTLSFSPATLVRLRRLSERIGVPRAWILEYALATMEGQLMETDRIVVNNAISAKLWEQMPANDTRGAK